MKDSIDPLEALIYFALPCFFDTLHVPMYPKHMFIVYWNHAQWTKEFLRVNGLRDGSGPQIFSSAWLIMKGSRDQALKYFV